MRNDLPPQPSLEKIAQLLPLIFREGCAFRSDIVSERTARTIYTFFYIGAIQSLGHQLRPSQVTIMTDTELVNLDEEQRAAWRQWSLSQGKNRDIEGRWYAENSRESIRDESIAKLIGVNAVYIDKSIPTNSQKPRYALKDPFAQLFLETQDNLPQSVDLWRECHLPTDDLQRNAALHSLDNESNEGISLPGRGEYRNLEPGESSKIIKAAIKYLIPAILTKPIICLLSQPGFKVPEADRAACLEFGLVIDESSTLPDIIAVDLSNPKKLLFIEAVATDGHITRPRRELLAEIALTGEWEACDVLYITAYRDRSCPVLRKNLPTLAWGTYTWFAAEPQGLLKLGHL